MASSFKEAFEQFSKIHQVGNSSDEPIIVYLNQKERDSINDTTHDLNKDDNKNLNRIVDNSTFFKDVDNGASVQTKESHVQYAGIWNINQKRLSDFTEDEKKKLVELYVNKTPIKHKYLNSIIITELLEDRFIAKSLNNGTFPFFYDDLDKTIFWRTANSVSLKDIAPKHPTPYIPKGYEVEKVLTPFEEECEYLQKVESLLDYLIEGFDSESRSLNAQLFDMPSGSYEDRTDKIYYMEKRDQARRQSERYELIKPSPYFGRMDFEITHLADAAETLIAYIGKEGLTDVGKQIVYDWRSSVGQFYYQKAQRAFNVGDYKYDLNLRRALHIVNAELKSINTEYERSQGETSVGEGIVDPFLIKILSDKRRERKLTDIIQSIQDKQIDIIRLPQKSNFIVQGCAGSGKTMILLHRLSYLKFNNPNLRWTNVKIITPNSFFDDFIREVSVILELNEIERLSVEQYYVHLIRKYNLGLSLNNDFLSEEALNEEMLHFIYSNDFKNQLAKQFDAYILLADQKLKELSLDRIFRGYGGGYTYPLKSTGAKKYYEQLNTALKALNEEIKTRDAGYSQTKLDLAQEEELIRNIDTSYRDHLERSRNQVVTYLTGASINSNKQQASIEQRIEELRNKNKEIQSNIATINKELDFLSNSSIEIGFTDPVEIDFSIIEDAGLREKAKAECKTIYTMAQQSWHDYENTSRINFTKRGRLKADYEKYREQYKGLIAQYFNSQRVNQQQKKADLLKQLEIIGVDLKQNEQSLERELNDIKLLESKSRVYQICLKRFENEQYPLLKELKDAYPDILEDVLSEYNDNYLVYQIKEKEYRAAINRKEKAQTRLNDLETMLATNEQKDALKLAQDVLDNLSIEAINSNVLSPILDSISNDYGISIQPDRYRFGLYVQLWMCYLYQGKLDNPDKWLNIDEAQDIDPNEYSLFKKVLGNDCIFNLYGDVNQLVYRYKGVEDWADISDIVGDTVYELNENYRNTIQITDYCNERFDADIYAIGVSGEPVNVVSMKDAISNIYSIKLKHPEYRVVIIHQSRENSIKKELQMMLYGQDVSWYSVDPGRLSVITVEQSKGLEFDAVVVINKGMNINDEYISYTRAMDNLFIVSSD